MSKLFRSLALPIFALALLAGSTFAGEWAVKDDVGVPPETTFENGKKPKADAKPFDPGRKVDVTLDGKLVARFVYGGDQIKPYLNLYSDEGDCLTRWDPNQDLPHHRGIYIGWNRIASDLGGPAKKGTTEPDPKGTFDLWHFNNGGKMEVTKIDKAEGGKDGATLVATVTWRAGNKDASGSNVLLTETRTMLITRPEAKKTQVDLKFELKAARDLTLGGDLQHSGMHFRGSADILKTKIQNDKAKNAITADYETAYVYDRDEEKKIKGNDLKWARLIFHLGPNWYSATHMNAPSNPVEELSMRAYGRFGFFFKKDLKKDETLTLNYRIVTESEKALKALPTADEKAASKKEGQALYDDFVKTVK